jgi:hypothetical protein
LSKSVVFIDKQFIKQHTENVNLYNLRYLLFTQHVIAGLERRHGPYREYRAEVIPAGRTNLTIAQSMRQNSYRWSCSIPIDNLTKLIPKWTTHQRGKNCMQQKLVSMKYDHKQLLSLEGIIILANKESV